jgi:hypothetical protein
MKNAAKVAHERTGNNAPSGGNGQRAETAEYAYRQTVTYAAFVKATGLPRRYVTAMRELGVLDGALVPAGRARRVRSIGMALVLWMDELLDYVVNGGWPMNDALLIDQQVRQDLISVWRPLLAGNPLSEVVAGKIVRHVKFLEAAQQRWTAAVVNGAQR